MRRTTLLPMLVIALVAAIILLLPRIDFYLVTGHWFQVSKMESLQNPIAIDGWKPEGLLLADGRTVQLPPFLKLPAESPALKEAISRGIDITSDGRVFGLVRVHHWCGNDPVREHIARVDLSNMLMYLQLAEQDSVTDSYFPTPQPAKLAFTASGWRVDEYGRFKIWEKMRSDFKK